jgi:LacI family transcriptional regulator
MSDSKRRRRPTQADVARHAGVSQTTVSLVLNNSAVIGVPEETRERVIAAMGALGYIPDRTARSLRTRKTYAIASVIPDITNPFYPAFERGIQDIADQNGYDLITYNTDGLLEKEQRCLRLLQGRQIDGIVAVFFHLTARDLLPLLESGIAIVRLEAVRKQPGDQPLDNVYVDNVAAARVAAEYLITRGHRRIGIIAGHLGPGRTRLLGYQSGLAAHGLSADQLLIQAGDFTVQSGIDCTNTLLAASPRPTAILAANDLIAMGALSAIRAAGLRVPEDIAVVGFDDIQSAALVSPPLTTVSLFQEQIGRRAAEMLLERLDGTAPAGGRCEELPASLVVRESA